MIYNRVWSVTPQMESNANNRKLAFLRLLDFSQAFDLFDHKLLCIPKPADKFLFFRSTLNIIFNYLSDLQISFYFSNLTLNIIYNYLSNRVCNVYVFKSIPLFFQYHKIFRIGSQAFLLPPLC